MTQSSEGVEVLVARFDALLLDLDGVLYIGEAPVPHAADALEQSAAAFGIRRAYITNNASRTPEQVVDVLAGVGVPADVSEVVTSAQVAAAYLAGQIAPGMPSWLWAVRGLERALEVNGLRPVRSLEDQPTAVVQGFRSGCRLARSGNCFGSCESWLGVGCEQRGHDDSHPDGLAPEMGPGCCSFGCDWAGSGRRWESRTHRLLRQPSNALDPSDR